MRSSSIEAGLRLISTWNPDWRPKYVLSDYDEGHISAAEQVFPGVIDAVRLFVLTFLQSVLCVNFVLPSLLRWLP